MFAAKYGVCAQKRETLTVGDSAEMIVCNT